uniref:Nucleotide-diphospho-sugar transferase domain-containing protein n=1 Tax=Mantoniella antarctica TaxID=81844 RepID=A0A7S0SFF3_9CHLO|mmetsp:Transcript_22366/g.55243  ORF Transcript_22366/g.55243 Transcript_22366/m.55243 type:complete len:583 (+) Transcript_22366:76-1824(+)
MSPTTRQRGFPWPLSSFPRAFAAAVYVLFALGALSWAGTSVIVRPVVWSVHGRVFDMGDTVAAREGAVLVPQAEEQSVTREATKGSERFRYQKVVEGREATRSFPTLLDSSGAVDDKDKGGDGNGDGASGLPVDLTRLPVQFASMRDTVDMSAEVRASMMKAGWREPTVNTTTPRHLYVQLRADLEAFVHAHQGGRQEEGDRPSIAAMGADSCGVVYVALGTSRYVDRAALVASRLLHYSPGTNITLFTDRRLWEQWTRMAETSAWAALEAPAPFKAFRADSNLVGAWMKTKSALVPWGRINPFTHVVFYDGIPWDTEQRASKAFAGNPSLNLSPTFFLKKLATFAAAPYDKTLFADADTCMCGSHLDDMWRELDDHELIHTIDPAMNQGGNHAGWNVRGHRVPPGETGFKERNVGFVLYRPSLKLNIVWHHAALLLLEAFRIKTPVLRNEQPAYTEAVYLWRHHLDERILDNSNDVCRKLDSRQKSICVKGQSEGYFPVGPLCAIGCRVTHEKCECWRVRQMANEALQTEAKTSAAVRHSRDMTALAVTRARRAGGTPRGTRLGQNARGRREAERLEPAGL